MKRNEPARLESEADLTPEMNRPERGGGGRGGGGGGEREARGRRSGSGLDWPSDWPADIKRSSRPCEVWFTGM